MINWSSNILICKNPLIFGVKLSICGFFQNKYLILRLTDWNYLFCDIVTTTTLLSVKSSQKKNKLLIITASTFNAYLVFMHTFESIMRSLTAVSNKRQAREAIMQSRAVFNLNNFEKGLWIWHKYKSFYIVHNVHNMSGVSVKGEHFRLRLRLRLLRFINHINKNRAN